jgi:hypothetical protein
MHPRAGQVDRPRSVRSSTAVRPDGLGIDRECIRDCASVAHRGAGQGCPVFSVGHVAAQPRCHGSSRSSMWNWRGRGAGAMLCTMPSDPVLSELLERCRHDRGAGGNRTPVHQPVIESATTIPGIATDAVTPTGRLSARGGPRSVFPVSQRSFSPSAVFPAVIPHFCCRAVMDWPRAAFLLTMVHSQPDESGGEGEAVVFNGSCVCCPV